MNDIIFDYYRGVEAEQYSFYRIPKMLFTDTIFQDLSCEAKVLYGLMLDRMSLSLKNHWMDEEERVYIIFTVNNICDLMNCGTQKAVRLLKELDVKTGIGLIEKKRLGLGKPNVIYVKNFMIKDEEGEKQQTEQRQSRIVEIEELQDKRQKFLNDENHNSGMMKMENQAVSETQLKNSENHNSGRRNLENLSDFELKFKEFCKIQEKIIKEKEAIASEAKFKNSENHNSGVAKITNPEFLKSQFKNDENHNSEVVKNNILEFSKSQSNKTDINKTDNNQSILSKNIDLSEDEMDKIDHCRKIVKEQISYTAFEQNKFYRIELVDELVELMTEIFMMPDESFERVNGTEKSIAVIKSRFCKINQLHIEYVLDSMQKNQTNIGNIKAYLLTALYNSTITMDSYYQARVNYDLRENF